jgi:hypothetical protein
MTQIDRFVLIIRLDIVEQEISIPGQEKGFLENNYRNERVEVLVLWPLKGICLYENA